MNNLGQDSYVYRVMYRRPDGELGAQPPIYVWREEANRKVEKCRLAENNWHYWLTAQQSISLPWKQFAAAMEIKWSLR